MTEPTSPAARVTLYICWKVFQQGEQKIVPTPFAHWFVVEEGLMWSGLLRTVAAGLTEEKYHRIGKPPLSSIHLPSKNWPLPDGHIDIVIDERGVTTSSSLGGKNGETWYDTTRTILNSAVRQITQGLSRQVLLNAAGDPLGPVETGAPDAAS